jgi:hypothetical protein
MSNFVEEGDYINPSPWARSSFNSHASVAAARGISHENQKANLTSLWEVRLEEKRSKSVKENIKTIPAPVRGMPKRELHRWRGRGNLPWSAFHQWKGYSKCISEKKRKTRR